MADNILGNQKLIDEANFILSQYYKMLKDKRYKKWEVEKWLKEMSKPLIAKGLNKSFFDIENKPKSFVELANKYN
jgi:hypothetical protein